MLGIRLRVSHNIFLRTVPAKRASHLLDMNRWLQAAYALCRGPLLPGLTAKSCRRGGATTAHHVGADRLLICRCADWDPAGTTLEVAYFDPVLTVDSAAAANLFGDLRVSARSS
jgi:hypothetical protein